MPGQQRLDVAKVVRRRHEAGGGQHPSKGKRDPGHMGRLPSKPRTGSRFFGGAGRGAGSGRRAVKIPNNVAAPSWRWSRQPRLTGQRIRDKNRNASTARWATCPPPSSSNHPHREITPFCGQAFRGTPSGWRGRRWLDVPGKTLVHGDDDGLGGSPFRRGACCVTWMVILSDAESGPARPGVG